MQGQVRRCLVETGGRGAYRCLPEPELLSRAARINGSVNQDHVLNSLLSRLGNCL